MKKALLLTDCSTDSALALNRWLKNQPDKLIDLTVVHAYAVPQEAGNPLKAVPFREAKQEATSRLSRWIDFLPCPWPGQLRSETLPGNEQQVLAMYLLLRRYDYLFLSTRQDDALAAFVTCRYQITTKLHWLDLPEEILDSANRQLMWRGALARIAAG